MSLYIIADIDAANGIAQAWTYYVKMLLQTDGLARNRTRRRIAVLDDPPRILFPKPILSVDLRVRFCKALIPEVQSAAFFLPGLRARPAANQFSRQSIPENTRIVHSSESLIGSHSYPNDSALMHFVGNWLARFRNDCASWKTRR